MLKIIFLVHTLDRKLKALNKRFNLFLSTYGQLSLVTNKKLKYSTGY